MSNQNSISSLSYALLGLIWQKRQSGYDLRKVFSSSPIRSFSDSPGAIYPALRRLEQRGLIRGQIDKERGRRERKVFELTAKGRADFRRWQTQPITRDDVVHDADALILRFAFMDGCAGRATSLRFLKAFRKQLAGYLADLRSYLKSNRQSMSVSGRLALQSGIQGYESLFCWTKAAIVVYQGKEN